MKRRKGSTLTLNDVGEDRIIDEIIGIFKNGAPSSNGGIGDDCALIQGDRDSYLFTTDILIEGVHFESKTIKSYDLGWKAVAVNLSDIGAMGGVPLFFMTSISFPPLASLKDIRSLYRGMKMCAKRFDVSLIGGNTSSSSIIVISVFMIGRMMGIQPIMRGGARDGDLIFITGRLGDSALGLKAIELGIPRNDPKVKRLIEKHVRPIPRVLIGRDLAAQHIPTSMIDLSDGFHRDLSRLLHSSNMGAEIWIEKLPISKESEHLSSRIGCDPVHLALGGGEDYEILFTAGEDKRSAIVEVSRRHRVEITAVGRVHGQPDIIYRTPYGERRHFDGLGFEHFKVRKDGSEADSLSNTKEVKKYR